jgi:hypothetical protein
MQPRNSLLLAAIVLGCTGSHEDVRGSANDGSAVPAEPTSAPPADSTGAPEVATDAEPMPLRRLNRVEYTNTLSDLLGLEWSLVMSFASEVLGPSGHAEGGPMSPAELDRMADSLDALAAEYLSTRLDIELPCALAQGDDACAQDFIKSFGLRAYRRPLSDQEVSDLFAEYASARLDRDFRGALGFVLRAMLLSPRFHYRWELGDQAPRLASGNIDAAGRIALNHYEVASRLSYFLWQSMPDSALLLAAERGELTDPSRVQAEAARMLADPVRGRAGVRGFFSAWLPLAKLSSDAAPELHGAMLESTLKFAEELVVGSGDRSYATLLGADYAFLNEPLAELLGVPGVTGAELRLVPLPDPSRAGLFTQPAFLTATSDSTLATIIRRGRFVYERLGTCAAVPAPSGAIPEAPVRPVDGSVREHLSLHATDGVCNQCHRYMDPMGFAFDAFDSLGRLREADDYGKPVNTRGVMPLGASRELSFSGAADLLRQLGSEEGSLRCFADQLTSFALRAPSSMNSRPSREQTANAFIAAGGDLYQLLLAATESHAFYHRTLSSGESTQ